MSRQCGFTLLEVLVVVGIMMLLLTLLPPLLPNVTDNQRMKAAARELAAGLRSARSGAITTQRPVAFGLDVKRRAYAQGDHSHPLDLPPETTLILRTATTEQTSSHVGAIRFFPDGSATGGEIVLGRGSRSYAIAVHWLTGRVTVTE